MQAQILNLMQDLQAELGLTYIFISHDLSVVEYIANRVAVMYVGKLVEVASTEDLFAKPRHPYTEALLSAIPKPDPRLRTQRIILEGEVADPANPPSDAIFIRVAVMPRLSVRPRCLSFVRSCRDTRWRATWRKSCVCGVWTRALPEADCIPAHDLVGSPVVCPC